MRETCGCRARAGVVAMAGLAACLTAAVPAHGQRAEPEFNPIEPPMQQYGDYMAGHGIALSSNYLGEFAANPAGGARQGAEFTGEFNLGADFDLAKLLGMSGSTVHVLFTDRAGNNL